MVVQSVDAALLRECTAAVPVGRLQQFLADMAESGNVFLTLSFYWVLQGTRIFV